ncbi:Nodule Cysteine-Rich (NCR) secreted peptide [Medicago truncatula]|uniref:Nodule Cysteine-Rich (NCR) secreted peptide n=1 Tax=Medicago truncatula TaxID=3880 RepID=A0A072VST7_MEDTR|nr:Nodule Cysteine-Rich (NCR) secreted peptide [Medicago truncatula]
MIIILNHMNVKLMKIVHKILLL